MQLRIDSGDLVLAAHLARPAGARHLERVLVVCPAMPSGPRASTGRGCADADLAERLANGSGWSVCAFDYRGTGASEGDFSVRGWLADVVAVVDRLLEREGAAEVWLAGFGEGGTLALCVAGEDQRVRGVAALGAPADFSAWSADPEGLRRRATELGLISRAAFPPDPAAWAAEPADIRPLELVTKIPPRPMLLVHGTADEVVSLMDPRTLADASEGHAELRILPGADHRLRLDPRAVAVLLGWLDRNAG